MPKPSTVFAVSHRVTHGKEVNVRIADKAYEAALKNITRSQDHICIMFKEAYEQEHGSTLPWIEFSDLEFNAQDESPEDRFFASGGCVCTCSRCNIGYHCHKPQKGCDA